MIKTTKCILPSKYNLILRLISFCLIGTFLSQELAFSAPENLLSSPAQNPLERILADPSRFEAPLDFSTLKEVHKGTNGKLIIHIQDAHSNISGQENLASMLDEIMEQYGVSLVLSEGGSDDCSLTPIKNIAPAEVWNQVARSYLLQGKLSGEEYLNLVSDRPMKIMGVEDLGLYVKSVQSYGKLARKRDEILSYLARAETAVEKLKNKLYPKELLDYERGKKAGDFDSNFKALFALAKTKQVSLSEFPAVSRLVGLTLEEKLLDFNMANIEQAALLDKIQEKGGEDRLREQLTRLNRSKNQKLSRLAYLENSFSIAKEKNIPLDVYPNLKAYEGYLRNFAALDLEVTLEEMEKAEAKVYGALLSGDSTTVRALDRYLGLLRTAYRIQMTTKDFNRFRSDSPDFPTASYLAFVNRKLADLGYFEDLVPYQGLFEEGKDSLESFYGSVEERDFAFLENTEKILNEENQKAAVLITGGYHTEHLMKLLEGKGYSIAVLSPIVSSETIQAKYEKRLLEPFVSETKEITVVSGESKKDRPLRALEKDGVRELLTALGLQPEARAAIQKNGDAELARLLEVSSARLAALKNDALSARGKLAPVKSTIAKVSKKTEAAGARLADSLDKVEEQIGDINEFESLAFVGDWSMLPLARKNDKPSAASEADLLRSFNAPTTSYLGWDLAGWAIPVSFFGAAMGIGDRDSNRIQRALIRRVNDLILSRGKQDGSYELSEEEKTYILEVIQGYEMVDQKTRNSYLFWPPKDAAQVRALADKWKQYFTPSGARLTDSALEWLPGGFGLALGSTLITASLYGSGALRVIMMAIGFPVLTIGVLSVLILSYRNIPAARFVLTPVYRQILRTLSAIPALDWLSEVEQNIQEPAARATRAQRTYQNDHFKIRIAGGNAEQVKMVRNALDRLSGKIPSEHARLLPMITIFDDDGEGEMGSVTPIKMLFGVRNMRIGVDTEPLSYEVENIEKTIAHEIGHLVEGAYPESMKFWERKVYSELKPSLSATRFNVAALTLPPLLLFGSVGAIALGAFLFTKEPWLLWVMGIAGFISAPTGIFMTVFDIRNNMAWNDFKSRANRGEEETITDYARTNWHEHFADSYAIFAVANDYFLDKAESFPPLRKQYNAMAEIFGTQQYSFDDIEQAGARLADRSALSADNIALAAELSIGMEEFGVTGRQIESAVATVQGSTMDFRVPFAFESESGERQEKLIVGDFESKIRDILNKGLEKRLVFTTVGIGEIPLEILRLRKMIYRSLLNTGETGAGWKVRILGVDASPSVVARAKKVMEVIESIEKGGETNLLELPESEMFDREALEKPVNEMLGVIAKARKVDFKIEIVYADARSLPALEAARKEVEALWGEPLESDYIFERYVSYSTLAAENFIFNREKEWFRLLYSYLISKNSLAAFGRKDVRYVQEPSNKPVEARGLPRALFSGSSGMGPAGSGVKVVVDFDAAKATRFVDYARNIQNSVDSGARLADEGMVKAVLAKIDEGERKLGWVAAVEGPLLSKAALIKAAEEGELILDEKGRLRFSDARRREMLPDFWYQGTVSTPQAARTLLLGDRSGFLDAGNLTRDRDYGEHYQGPEELVLEFDFSKDRLKALEYFNGAFGRSVSLEKPLPLSFLSARSKAELLSRLPNATDTELEKAADSLGLTNDEEKQLVLSFLLPLKNDEPNGLEDGHAGVYIQDIQKAVRALESIPNPSDELEAMIIRLDDLAIKPGKIPPFYPIANFLWQAAPESDSYKSAVEALTIVVRLSAIEELSSAEGRLKALADKNEKERYMIADLHELVLDLRAASNTKEAVVAGYELIADMRTHLNELNLEDPDNDEDGAIRRSLSWVIQMFENLEAFDGGAAAGARLAVSPAERAAISAQAMELRDYLAANYSEGLKQLPNESFTTMVRTLIKQAKPDLALEYLSHGPEFVVFGSARYPGVVFVMPKRDDRRQYWVQYVERLEQIALGKKISSEEAIRKVDGFQLVALPGLAPTAVTDAGLIIQEKADVTVNDDPLARSEGSWSRTNLKKKISSWGGQYWNVNDASEGVLENGQTVVVDLVAVSLPAAPSGARLAALKEGAEWDRVLFDKVDAALSLTEPDLQLLNEIMQGDENVLSGLLKTYPDKIFIKAEDQADTENDGRTVYLHLDQPFTSNGHTYQMLRIKGARPRAAAILPHVGSGRTDYQVQATLDGKILVVRKPVSIAAMLRGQPVLDSDPGVLSPLGVMTKSAAENEFKIMQEGQKEGAGFETDYPVAAGTWKKLSYADAELGFVIAGVEGGDIRLAKRASDEPEPYNLLVDVVSGRSITISPEMAPVLYRELGRSLRAYHDRGYFHKQPHPMNIGVRMDASGKPAVVLRDLDMSEALNAASQRLIDVQRVVYYLARYGLAGDTWSYLNSFLEGYFHELTADPQRMLDLEAAVHQRGFVFLVEDLRESGGELALEKAPVTHLVWTELEALSTNRGARLAQAISAEQRKEVLEKAVPALEKAIEKGLSKDSERLLLEMISELKNRVIDSNLIVQAIGDLHSIRYDDMVSLDHKEADVHLRDALIILIRARVTLALSSAENFLGQAGMEEFGWLLEGVKEQAVEFDPEKLEALKNDFDIKRREIVRGSAEGDETLEPKIELLYQVGEELTNANDGFNDLVELGVFTAGARLADSEKKNELLHLFKMLEAAIARERAGFEMKLATVNDEANLDPMTGLKNRKYYEEVVPQVIEQSQRQNSPVSMIMIDLDRFKEINDRNGHDVGDEVLRYVARVLKAVVRRRADIIVRDDRQPVRIGGEEILVVLPGTDARGAAQLAWAINTMLNMRLDPMGDLEDPANQDWSTRAFKVLGTKLDRKTGKMVDTDDRDITASFGVAEWRAGETSEELRKRADEALYQAKTTGRNRVVIAKSDGARLAANDAVTPDSWGRMEPAIRNAALLMHARIQPVIEQMKATDPKNDLKRLVELSGTLIELVRRPGMSPEEQVVYDTLAFGAPVAEYDIVNPAASMSNFGAIPQEMLEERHYQTMANSVAKIARVSEWLKNYGENGRPTLPIDGRERPGGSLFIRLDSDAAQGRPVAGARLAAFPAEMVRTTDEIAPEALDLLTVVADRNQGTIPFGITETKYAAIRISEAGKNSVNVELVDPRSNEIFSSFIVTKEDVRQARGRISARFSATTLPVDAENREAVEAARDYQALNSVSRMLFSQWAKTVTTEQNVLLSLGVEQQDAAGMIVQINELKDELQKLKESSPDIRLNIFIQLVDGEGKRLDSFEGFLSDNIPQTKEVKHMYSGVLSDEFFAAAKNAGSAGLLPMQAARMDGGSYNVVPYKPDMRTAIMMAVADAHEPSLVRALKALTRANVGIAEVQIVQEIPADADRSLYERKDLIVKALATLSETLYKAYVSLIATGASA